MDLVDGDELCELLKQFRLGVDAERREIETVLVEKQFFEEI